LGGPLGAPPRGPKEGHPPETKNETKTVLQKSPRRSPNVFFVKQKLKLVRRPPTETQKT